MKKSDLKTGMIVKTRGGKTALVVRNTFFESGIFGKNDVIIFAKNNWASLNSYFDDLTWDGDCRQFDIIEVYTPHLPCDFLSIDTLTNKRWGEFPCIWKRDKFRIVIERSIDKTVITIYK